MASLDYSGRMTLTGAARRRPGLFARTFGAFSAWREARMTRDMLHKLTDRELDDIGLTRADIDRAADEGWRR